MADYGDDTIASIFFYFNRFIENCLKIRRPARVRELESGRLKTVKTINESRIQTVIAAVISSNVALAAAPGNVLLGRRDSKLPKESVVNVSQVVTLNKSFLTERVGHLSARHLGAVDEGLRLALAL